MKDAASTGRGPLSLAAGFAAILAATILLIGVAGVAIGSPGRANWLAVLFAINAGSGGASPESLGAFNPLDITLLVLAGAAFAGFWPGPGRPHKVWMGLAIGLPLAGIGVLLATGLAGRSGLMGGGLVLSSLMVGDRASRPLGCLGIAACSLLLVGDLSTTGSRAPAIAGVVAVGYVLLVAWFVWIAGTLLMTTESSGATRHA